MIHMSISRRLFLITLKAEHDAGRDWRSLFGDLPDDVEYGEALAAVLCWPEHLTSCDCEKTDDGRCTGRPREEG